VLWGDKLGDGNPKVKFIPDNQVDIKFMADGVSVELLLINVRWSPFTAELVFSAESKKIMHLRNLQRTCRHL
jgi:hypothetical protein